MMERATLALIAALGIAAAGAGAIAFGEEPAHVKGPQILIDVEAASFNQSAETLELQIDRAMYTRDGEPVTVEKVRINHTTFDGRTVHNWTMRTTVQRGENVSNFWYHRDGGGVQSAPPQPGDTITIIGDQTDKDGDGRYGVESEEAYQLALYTERGTVVPDVIRIENGSVCGPECQAE